MDKILLNREECCTVFVISSYSYRGLFINSYKKQYCQQKLLTDNFNCSSAKEFEQIMAGFCSIYFNYVSHNCPHSSSG